MIPDMNLSKAEGLAKVAKDAAAMENITLGDDVGCARASAAPTRPATSSSLSSGPEVAELPVATTEFYQ
jgi:hypothetical protein